VICDCGRVSGCEWLRAVWCLLLQLAAAGVFFLTHWALAHWWLLVAVVAVVVVDVVVVVVVVAVAVVVLRGCGGRGDYDGHGCQSNPGATNTPHARAECTPPAFRFRCY
jgi:hypothetical protein